MKSNRKKTYCSSNYIKYKKIVKNFNYFLLLHYNNLLVNNSVLVTYNNNLEKQDEKIYKGNNTYTLKNIFVSDDEYVLSGHTNSKLKDIKKNGKDYYNVIIKNS